MLMYTLSSDQDPEMQRHQNFITVTLDTNDTWTKLRNNPAAERVQVPLRYTLDRAEILNAERGRNQGVGLREIAPLIGLKLGSNLQPTKTGRTATTDSQIEEMDSTMTDPSKLMLADFDRRPEEMCTVGLKLVPRENRKWRDRAACSSGRNLNLTFVPFGFYNFSRNRSSSKACVSSKGQCRCRRGCPSRDRHQEIL